MKCSFALSTILLLSIPLTARTLAHAEEKLRIGAILPLSGGLAEYGVATRNGLAMGLADLPELTKNLAFSYEDSRYDNAMTVTALQKLAPKIDLAFVWGANPNEAAVPVAELKHIPTMAVTTSRFLTRDKNWSVRFSSPSTIDAQYILSWLRKNSAKKICLVKTELTFINGIADAMYGALQTDEYIDLIDTYSYGDQDFKSSIIKILQRSCDALGIFLATGQVAQFYKELRKAGFQGKTFGSDFFDSYTEIKNSENTMNGAVFPSPRVSEAFRERYIKAYGNDAQIGFAKNGYNFILLLQELFKNGKNPGRNLDLINSIKQIATYSSEEGTITYADLPSPGFTFPNSLKVIKENQISELE